MAFWQRRKSRVFIYYRENGKTRVMPRDRTRHLDNAPDHNIDAFVAEHFGLGRKGPSVPTPAALQNYIELYLKEIGDKDPKTVHSHKQSLYDYIIPYLVKECQAPDPGHWPNHTAKLAPYLREKGESEHRIARVNAALRGFWTYLQNEGAVPAALAIRIRPAKIRQEPTPLRLTLSPDQVWAILPSDPRLRLAGLLGYFFSLRPQETFGLRVTDFRTGSKAVGLESCRVMERAKLYHKFAVHIERQRTQKGALPPPKAYSKGWVSCFDERAAKEIVGILREMDQTELIFAEWQNDWWFELWDRAKTGFTLKDLRRASLYWLGHYTALEFVGLKSHARHRKPETTLGYLRRPETLTEQDEIVLDLDA